MSFSLYHSYVIMNVTNRNLSHLWQVRYAIILLGWRYFKVWPNHSILNYHIIIIAICSKTKCNLLWAISTSYKKTLVTDLYLVLYSLHVNITDRGWVFLLKMSKFILGLYKYIEAKELCPCRLQYSVSYSIMTLATDSYLLLHLRDWILVMWYSMVKYRHTWKKPFKWWNQWVKKSLNLYTKFHKQLWSYHNIWNQQYKHL